MWSDKSSKLDLQSRLVSRVSVFLAIEIDRQRTRGSFQHETVVRIDPVEPVSHDLGDVHGHERRLLGYGHLIDLDAANTGVVRGRQRGFIPRSEGSSHVQ